MVHVSKKLHFTKGILERYTAHTNVSLAEWGGKTNTGEIAVNLISIVRFTAIQTLLSHQKKFATLLTQEIGSPEISLLMKRMNHIDQPMLFHVKFLFVYASPN